jgi:hypothetical protein
MEPKQDFAESYYVLLVFKPFVEEGWSVKGNAES